MNPSVDTEIPAPRSAGRPRSEGCRLKILQAADGLLARDGFAKMSVDAIAQSAGVSKATIYRWWPNKAAIVMEAVLESTEAELFVPVSDFPGDELMARLRRTIQLFRGPKGAMIRSLIGQAQSDPELAEAYRQRLLGPRRAAMRDAIQRCIAAGLLRAGIDIDLAIDMIYGPLYTRLLLGHAAIDEAFTQDYPRIALAALRAYASPEARG